MPQLSHLHASYMYFLLGCKILKKFDKNKIKSLNFIYQKWIYPNIEHVTSHTMGTVKKS